MQESEWVALYGDEALRRAQEEGYQTKRGIGERIFQLLETATGMQSVDQAKWVDHGERTSPRADAFARRDEVLDAVRNTVLPQGWSVEVSRIVRVTVCGPVAPLHFTGVVVEVRGPKRAVVSRKALDFENLFVS